MSATEAKERANRKGGGEKDADKPDTFTEKLAAHLMKNLRVSNDTNNAGIASQTCFTYAMMLND